MNAEALTPEVILDMAEQVLRRYGPAKTNVVDVARALGVSHGTVYRHYPSKAALRDAVAARWLARVSEPLRDIAHKDAPADIRLREWLVELSQAKRRKVFEEPEMFATYHAIAEAAHGVVDAHVAELTQQISTIIADGQSQGLFRVDDSDRAARAVFDATLRFHHPAHTSQWQHSGIDDAFEAVISVLLSGLYAGVAAHQSPS